MTCAESEIMLHALLDGELDAGHALEVETHLATCPRCAAQLRAYRELQQAMPAAQLRFAAPMSLRRRIEAALPSPPARASSRRSVLKGFAMGSALSAAMAATLVVAVIRTDQDQRALGDALSAHLRSLQGEHLTDVQTSDQHTVKPWFNGRLDVAPPVVDLTAQGFTADRRAAGLHRRQGRRRHRLSAPDPCDQSLHRAGRGLGTQRREDREGPGIQYPALERGWPRILGRQRHRCRGAAGIRRQVRGGPA